MSDVLKIRGTYLISQITVFMTSALRTYSLTTTASRQHGRIFNELPRGGSLFSVLWNHQHRTKYWFHRILNVAAHSKQVRCPQDLYRQESCHHYQRLKYSLIRVLIFQKHPSLTDTPSEAPIAHEIACTFYEVGRYNH
ncbi:MAG TPA: hypothetical protein ACQGQH_09350 [Xylella sp.]